MLSFPQAFPLRPSHRPICWFQSNDISEHMSSPNSWECFSLFRWRICVLCSIFLSFLILDLLSLSYQSNRCMLSLGGGVCVCVSYWIFSILSYVRFLNLHSINDLILFWASLRFQFLGLIDYFAISDAFILQAFTKHLCLPTLLPNQ